MVEHAEQLVGTLFRVLEEEGHDEAQDLLMNAYRSNASTDRDDLTADLMSDLVAVLHRHLDAREQAAVLTTAMESFAERFLAVVEVVPVAVVVVDPDGRVRLWNEGAQRTFGWSASAMRGEQYRTLLPPAADGLGEFPDRLRQGERLTGIETRHRHEDGSILDVRIWAAPLHRQDGEFDGAAVVVSDITARKQREQRLTVLNRVLRHNIRNDVTVIRGHLDMVSDTGDDGADHLAVVDDRLANITELSDAARHIERLRDEGDGGLTTHDLASLLRDRLDRLRREWPAAEIEGRVPDAAPVVAHELLPFALDNVLENAVEHNPSATPRVAVAVSDAAGDSPAYRTVRIDDDGPGLPEGERAVLTNGTETALTHSDGLGLWLTRWILRSSGGNLDIDTSEFGGTSVRIRLQSPRGGDAA